MDLRIGTSAQGNTREAVAEAARTALAACTSSPALALVFATFDYPPDEVAAAVNHELGVSVRLELEVPHPLPPLLLDARLVRRAVINLVCNAVQSMPRGGRIVARLLEDALDGRPAGRIEVTDDGPGIPRETQARIFEPFFTTRASGTGLGLSIVRRVAEAHHGELTVRSDGPGTTFIIRLPSFAGETSGRSAVD